MYKKLTYTLFLSCVACLIASCSSDTPDSVDVSKGAELTFAAVDPSRAVVTTSISNFAVYGDIRRPDNTNRTVIFNKTEVKHTGDAWTYSGTQYWFPEYEHSFVAINPLSVLEEANNPVYVNSQLAFTYTLPDATDKPTYDSKVKDIIAATHRRYYDKEPVFGKETTPEEKVTFKFGHLLSLINFSIELNDAFMGNTEYFKIRKIEMSGFGTSAGISIKPAPMQSNVQTDDSEIAIVTNQEAKGTLTIEFTEPIKVTNGAGHIQLFNSADAIIMLPQTFDADTEAKIVLTYSINEEEATTQVATSLSGFKWESGRSYNYKSKLSTGKIVLQIENTEIVPWNLIDDHDEVDAR